MDINTAKQVVGKNGVVVMDSMGGDIWGTLEYVRGEWAGVRGPKAPGAAQGRLDEIQVSRLVLTNT